MKAKFFFIGLVIIIGICFFYTRVYAQATYYVSPSGNDTNPGTQNAPFKTFSKSMSVLSSGDTLIVMGGTYTQQLDVTRSGITIRAQSGVRPIIDAQGSGSAPVRIGAGISNVSLYGLGVTRSNFECVLLEGNNVLIHDFDVYNCLKFGYRVKGTSITIENSTCRDSVTENVNGTNTSGGWGSCLKTGPGSGNLIFRDNHIYNNWGEGLIIGQAAGAKAYRNLIHDNYSQNIYIGNSFDTDVYQNMTYSTNSRYFRGGSPANCISASEELISGWGAQLHNIRVYNNIAYGCKFGMGYSYKEVPDNGCDTCVFAYNTLVNTGGFKIIDGTKNHIRIENNIMRGGTISVPAGDIVVQNNYTGDPLFVGIPGTDPSTYQLRSGSPVINTGSPISWITTDFSGASRDSRPDVGAFEYGGNAPTIGTTPLVATPTRTPTPSGAVIGDLNGDRHVDIFDYNILLGNFGRSGNPGFVSADINRDGGVDIFDYNLLLGNFGR